MAKKKTTKHIPLLSPENYIRKKSRNLPISQCYINDDWKEGGLASICIVREHASGNISMCMYMVDIFCLGVKDTFFQYNISTYELEEYLDRMRNDLDLISIPYDLAHNIIFAAEEFAEEYGIKPHKDFTLTTRFFLEEDDENIPLIEIECGRDGKPFYINNGYENKVREAQILNLLNKTAGEGNYHFTVNGDFDDDDFEEDEELELYKEEYEKLQKLGFEEQKKYYFELSEKDPEKVSEKEFKELLAVTELLVNKFIDEDKCLEITNEIKSDWNLGELLEIDEFPNSLLEGVPEEKSEIVELYDQFNEVQDKEAKKILVQMRELVGDIPFCDYCELILLNDNKKKHEKLLNEILKKYPEYPCFRMQKINAGLGTNSDVEKAKALFEELKHVFDNRSNITYLEYEYFIICYAMLFFVVKNSKPDLEEISALGNCFSRIASELNPEAASVLFMLIKIRKDEILSQLLEK